MAEITITKEDLASLNGKVVVVTGKLGSCIRHIL
jgi:hypothetical protein